VGLTRPFVPYVTHQVGVVALHMNTRCVTEPLADLLIRFDLMTALALCAYSGFPPAASAETAASMADMPPTEGKASGATPCPARMSRGSR
jgi:hypothetical protein